MENYYQRNMDQYECARSSGVSYNQTYGDVVVIEPSGEQSWPITVDELKDFSGIDISEDDALLAVLIGSAFLMCETHTNIGFVRREVQVTLNNCNGGTFLPMGPVGDIISTTDEDGNAIEAKYSVGDWKQVLSPRDERLVITYESGYEELPANLRTAVLNCARYLYDNRGQGADGIGPIAKMILDPLSKIW